MRSRALSGYRREHRRLRRMSHLPILQEGVYYHCPLDLRKRHNLALQRVEGRGRLRFDFSFPHILHVGVTTYCNLRCPACPTGTRALGRPRQHLEYHVFARRVDELRPGWEWSASTLTWDCRPTRGLPCGNSTASHPSRARTGRP